MAFETSLMEQIPHDVEHHASGFHDQVESAQHTLSAENVDYSVIVDGLADLEDHGRGFYGYDLDAKDTSIQTAQKAEAEFVAGEVRRHANDLASKTLDKGGQDEFDYEMDSKIPVIRRDIEQTHDNQGVIQNIRNWRLFKAILIGATVMRLSAAMDTDKFINTNGPYEMDRTEQVG